MTDEYPLRLYFSLALLYASTKKCSHINKYSQTIRLACLPSHARVTCSARSIENHDKLELRAKGINEIYTTT